MSTHSVVTVSAVPKMRQTTIGALRRGLGLTAGVADVAVPPENR
jgi:hypothetical protein